MKKQNIKHVEFHDFSISCNLHDSETGLCCWVKLQYTTSCSFAICPRVTEVSKSKSSKL